jgi:hypothetical protein
VSNHLAIAAVTAGLKSLLEPIVENAVGGASVQFGRPNNADASTKAVNIYLYQVTPNSAYRNADLPTRRSDGTLANRPQAALDLHYLFTFHGDDSKFEPQRLLGVVATKLHAHPLLSRADIQGGLNMFKPLLDESDLADQPEPIRITPTALSLEEFSKLWSAFFQIEYTLSMVYQASVVLLESDDAAPTSSPPPKVSNIYVAPLRGPRVDRVVALSGGGQPIVATSTLQIEGAELSGDLVVVLMDGQEYAPSSIADAQILLPMPSSLRAGLKGLRVVQKTPLGAGSPHPGCGFESNLARFVYSPTLIKAKAAANATPPGFSVTATLAPNVAAGQRVVLLLNDPTADPPVAYVSPPTLMTADGPQVTFLVTAIPNGPYLARVQVDGAESLPQPLS